MQVREFRFARSAAAAAAAAMLVVAGCASSGTPSAAAPSGGVTSGAALPSSRTFGTGPAEELLTLTPPQPGDKPVVQRSVAQTDVDHPDAAPRPLHPVLFTLARATAPMVGWSGTSTAPVFRSTLAWVGVFEVDPNAPHSCPGGPPTSPVSLPPLQEHYYFAVLVDATTGAEGTWNEDMSGLLMRQCAAMWSSWSSQS
jgi:hypothetical protein